LIRPALTLSNIGCNLYSAVVRTLKSPRLTSLSTLAWVVIVASTLVMLQGALVRATGSGAGCGSHWPTCNGEVIPLIGSTETVMEYSHRILSFLVLVLGVLLLARAWRWRHHRPGLFMFAMMALVLLIFEALLGGATVLLGLTGGNATVGRGIMVASHLINSLLLIGVLTGTVLYSQERSPAWPLSVGRQGFLATVLGLGLMGMVVVMFSGGIAAMGNTMFPAESLAGGLAADFDPDSHPLIRLRVLHPLIAVGVGVYLFLSLGFGWWVKPVSQARRLVQFLLGVYLVQLVIGIVNFSLLAPVALQLLHLGVAILAFALLSAVFIVVLGSPVVGTRAGLGPRGMPGGESA
jgi:cytochrome c oxidase assembly protein subunit 15